MDESIWKLPGPDRLVGQVTQEVQRGRHVAVVLPAVRAAEETFVDGLVAAIMRTLVAAGEDPRRAGMPRPDTNPVRWLAECLVFDEELPVVVGDLLDHADAAGRTAILDCTGLEPGEQQRFSAFLTRLALESRPRSAGRRPRVVVIGTRRVLPQLGADNTEVTFETVWWWGRLNRWDVASRLSPAIEATGWENVLGEVRLETVLEVCRWDLDLAECLARTWDGDPGSLDSAIMDTGPAPSTSDRATVRGGRLSRSRPPDDVADLWDTGRVELWQHEHCPSPHELARRGGVERAAWVAQTRVLLPWIEVRRQRLYELLRARFGERAIGYGSGTSGGYGGGDPSPVEVGPLFVATRELIPRGDSAVRDAARNLMTARNKLAHLQSLTVADQRRLLAADAVLLPTAH